MGPSFWDFAIVRGPTHPTWTSGRQTLNRRGCLDSRTTAWSSREGGAWEWGPLGNGRKVFVLFQNRPIVRIRGTSLTSPDPVWYYANVSGPIRDEAGRNPSGRPPKEASHG